MGHTVLPKNYAQNPVPVLGGPVPLAAGPSYALFGASPDASNPRQDHTSCRLNSHHAAEVTSRALFLAYFYCGRQ